MKISDSLRRAIKSVCDASQANYVKRRCAISAWAHSHPKIKKILARRAKLSAQLDQVRGELLFFGLRGDDCIENMDQAVAHGFKSQTFEHSYDRFIRDLAKASPEDGAKMLKELGVNWE